MKTFLFEILRFLVLMLLTAFGIIFIQFYIVKSEGIIIEKSKNILVLGDSHTECAIDDQIVLRCANFSESGTTYYYSLLKLKKILHDNNQIDTLLLSFHFGSIDKDNDEEYLYNKAYNHERLKKVIPFFTIKDYTEYYDKILLIESMLNSPLHYFPFIFSGLLNGNYQTPLMNLGRFSASNRNELKEDLQKRLEAGPFKVKTDYSQNEINLLFHIDQVCKDNHVKLILINTPIYHAQNYTDICLYLRFLEMYPDKFTVWDFSSFNPGEDGFSDVSHLNLSGARAFSIFLNKELSSPTSVK